MDANENVVKFKLSSRTLGERLLTRRRMLATGAAAGGAMLLNGSGAVAQDAQPPARDSAAVTTTRPADKAFDFEEKNPSRDNVPEARAPLPPVISLI